MLSEVSSADVLEILTPIWHRKAETARRVRLRLRAVLEWAVAMEYRIDNPCDRVSARSLAPNKRHRRDPRRRKLDPSRSGRGRRFLVRVVDLTHDGVESAVAFDGVPIGISDGLPKNRRFCLGRCRV